MPMNECSNNEVRDQLPLLASGGHVASSAEVEAHVASCLACQEELRILKAARRALLRAPAMDPARIAGALPAYRQAPHSEPEVVSIESRRRRAPAWRIAAAALIVVASGTALVLRQAEDDMANRPVVASIDSSGRASPEPTAVAVQPLAGNAGPVAGASGAGAGSPAVADTGTQMTFGGGIGDLSDDELVALLAALDDEEALTPAEPDEVFPSMAVDDEEEI